MDMSVTDAASAIASATSTAFTTVTTSLQDSWSEWDSGDIIYNGKANGTDISPVDHELSEGSYILNTILGLLIVLVSSAFNAFGLNLTKLDHMRQQGIPKQHRRREYLRFLWLAGMGTYIASQSFGSPLALRYLRPDWVAPLGSFSLIFNFIFARWLVGTPVTATDVRGTAVIVIGVFLILIFSSINHGLTQALGIDRLNSLWTRPSWLAYFVFLVTFTSTTYFAANTLAKLISSRASLSPQLSPTSELPTSRPKPAHPVIAFFHNSLQGWRRMERLILVRLEQLLQRTDDARIIWLQGMGWAVAGGSLAGLCLVFTKAAVKIFWLPGHPLLHPSPLITLILVIFTAILQIVCLNRALNCADTVVVVPLFYAGYTIFGFMNSLIFFNETQSYPRWVLVATFLSITVLITGVVLLSLKSSAKTAPDPYIVVAHPGNSIRVRPRARAKPLPDDRSPIENGDGSTNGQKRDDVLWEVGSASDGDDEEEEKRRGVDQGKRGQGERKGLLGDEEDHEIEGDGGESSARPGRDPFADEEDDFGGYEGVPSRPDHA